MTPDEKLAYARAFPVHVGVDTAKRCHVLVARGPDGRRRGAQSVPVTRAGFTQAVADLRTSFPEVVEAQMLVGLEFAGHHGFTFAHHLAQAGFAVVNVLPLYTKRLKELEDNSPLKTDARDAALICALVGDGHFVRFPFLQSPYAELRVLTVQRHRLVVEATRLKNRLQGLLDLAWPEYLPLMGSLAKATPRAILRRWPLPADLLAAPRRSVARVVRAVSRGHVPPPRLRTLLDGARTTIALPSAAPARRLEITQLLARWALLDAQRTEVEARLRALVLTCPPAERLLSVPEVSATCAATLVAELGTPDDYQHPRQVLKLAGMNLVEQSSASLQGRRYQSKRGRPMLRRQLFLLAGRWCQARGLYRPDYLALLARNGGRKTKAVCAVARKLVPLLLRVMQGGGPFDRARWQAGRHEALAAR
jgi:transposase